MSSKNKAGVLYEQYYKKVCDADDAHELAINNAKKARSLAIETARKELDEGLKAVVEEEKHCRCGSKHCELKNAV